MSTINGKSIGDTEDIPDNAPLSWYLVNVAEWLTLGDRAFEQLGAAQGKDVVMSDDAQTDLKRLAHFLKTYPYMDEFLGAAMRGDEVLP
jgi:hypothetical protein